MVTLRRATPDDLPAICRLIPLAARGLSAGWYSAEQIESAIEYVFGPDSLLIADGTYWIAEADQVLVGCGGWSQRATLYGGDQMKGAADPLLDPKTDAARIRAFFTHPRWARQGIGGSILQRCVEGARAAGFRRLELMATLPGVPLYRHYGFEEAEPVRTRLPDGVELPFVRMVRSVVDAGSERPMAL